MARVPRRVYRGLRRSLIRKLQNSLASILAMDARESIRAGAIDVDGTYFQPAGNTSVRAAITTLQNRCSEALLEKA